MVGSHNIKTFGKFFPIPSCSEMFPEKLRKLRIITMQKKTESDVREENEREIIVVPGIFSKTAKRISTVNFELMEDSELATFNIFSKKYLKILSPGELMFSTRVVVFCLLVNLYRIRSSLPR